MTVFRGILRIAYRKIWIAVLFFGIFLGITMMFAVSESDATEKMAYKARSVSIAVIDRDQSESSALLKEYLGKKHDLVNLKDQADVLEEELYYETVQHILIIPKGYEESCREGTEEVIQIDGTNRGSSAYIQLDIDAYLKLVDSLVVGGNSVVQASTYAVEYSLDEASVQLVNNGTQNTTRSEYYFFFRYLPYMFLTILTYLFGNILIHTSAPEIKMRMACSNISLQRQSFQKFLAFSCIGAAVFVGAIGTAFILYHKIIFQEPLLGYYIVNAFALIIVVLAIAYLVGAVEMGRNALSGVTNILSLGMCFIGGVFIPLQYLPAAVLKVSKFLPTYWYEVNCNYLTKFKVLEGDNLKQFLLGILVQFALAAVAFVITLVLGRNKNL